MKSALHTDGKARCGWATSDPLYVRYHDEEWGVPVHDDRTSSSFSPSRAPRPGSRGSPSCASVKATARAFSGFDPRKVARYDARKVERLMADACIVRNRLKIESTISNARAFLAVQKELGSFDRYVWQLRRRHAEGEPADAREIAPAPHRRVRRHEPRPEEAGLPLRRLDHLLRVHAGLRSRERPRGELLPRPSAPPHLMIDS